MTNLDWATKTTRSCGRGYRTHNQDIYGDRISLVRTIKVVVVLIFVPRATNNWVLLVDNQVHVSQMLPDLIRRAEARCASSNTDDSQMSCVAKGEVWDLKLEIRDVRHMVCTVNGDASHFGIVYAMVYEIAGCNDM